MVIDGAKYVDSKFGMRGTLFGKPVRLSWALWKSVKRMCVAFAKRYRDEPRHKKASKHCNYLSDIKQGTWDLAIQRIRAARSHGPTLRSLRSNVKGKNKDIDRRQLSQWGSRLFLIALQHLIIYKSCCSCLSSSHVFVEACLSHFWTRSHFPYAPWCWNSCQHLP